MTASAIVVAVSAGLASAVEFVEALTSAASLSVRYVEGDCRNSFAYCCIAGGPGNILPGSFS